MCMLLYCLSHAMLLAKQSASLFRDDANLFTELTGFDYVRKSACDARNASSSIPYYVSIRVIINYHVNVLCSMLCCRAISCIVSTLMVAFQ